MATQPSPPADERVDSAHQDIRRLIDTVNSVILGKEEVVERTLAALFSRGHLLIEDVPGVGKTMLAKALAKSIDADFSRIQFTPDLLPADVTGSTVFDQVESEFYFQPGPVFTNILLADEINRTSPRTQSSLLEAMEEHQVTVDGETHRLEDLFFVIATQNPIEHQGTYELPEAQLDRFLMRQSIGYPDSEIEVEILEEQQYSHPIEEVEPVVEPQDILEFQELTRSVHVSESLLSYIVQLISYSREHPDVDVGVSPRGSLALRRAAQATALIEGKNFVTPDHIQQIAPFVLSHRIILHTEAELSGVNQQLVIDEVLERTPVPTE